MALIKKGKWRYGENQSDIQHEIKRYSKSNTYIAEHFLDAVCDCSNTIFHLSVGSNEDVAVRTCCRCRNAHPIGDSQEYLEDSNLEECACPCEAEEFEITCGIALYKNSEDVKWLYLGCRCVKCGLTAIYADWKSESGNYRDFLKVV